MKNKKCKICSKAHSSKGFCKSHASAHRRGLITQDGQPKDGYYFNENFHLRKVKNTFPRTIKESPWYRRWVSEVIQQAGKKCSKCNKTKVRLYAHHHKIRFSEILKAAFEKHDTFLERMIYCRFQHTNDIAMCLCSDCHAEAHKGEKVYNSLKGLRQRQTCLLCEEESYCRNFCRKHYGQYRNGVYDAKGNKLRLLQYELKTPVSKPPKIERRIEPCKVCKKKHYGKGFCLTHYNRYRLGQIDSEGLELRHLKVVKIPSRMIEYDGRIKSIDDWAESLNITRPGLMRRLKKWDLEKALTFPVRTVYSSWKTK